MENINYKNRGMLLETIVNKTINYYNENQIAFFAKKNLDAKFSSIKKQGNNKILTDAFLFKKSTVDYYGVFQGRYVTFEAKSTDDEYFYFSNIRSHQHEHLKKISKLGGWAFYLIFFKKYSKIFLFNVEEIDIENKKKISLNELKDSKKEIEIIFPGIVDFLSQYERK